MNFWHQIDKAKRFVINTITNTGRTVLSLANWLACFGIIALLAATLLLKMGVKVPYLTAQNPIDLAWFAGIWVAMNVANAKISIKL
jgi:hypothetical protein